MEIRIRVFLLNRVLERTLKLAVVASAALVLQGCGLFHHKKEPPPLGAEVEKQTGPDASEQPVINPEVERRKVKTPRVGGQDFEAGAYVGVLGIEDFGTSSVVGVRGDYHVTEDLFFEGSLGRSKGGTTSYERLAGGPKLIPDADRYYTYWAINAGWDALPGEIFIGKGQAYNSAFYFTAGVGNTKFAGDWHFTANAGMGYRILVARVVTVHFDFRDYLFDSDLLGEKKVTHNLEGSLGLSFFF